MAKQISSIYGDALFSLALEENAVDRLEEEIGLAREVFLANSELMRLLNHPEIVKEDKQALVEDSFRGKVSDEVLGFFHVIIEKDRQKEMLSIFEHFLKKVRQYRKIGSASVTAFAQANENAEQTEATEQVIEEQPAEQPADTQTPEPEAPAEGETGSGDTAGEAPSISLPTQEEVEQAASSIYNAASSIWGAIQDAASQQNDAA